MKKWSKIRFRYNIHYRDASHGISRTPPFHPHFSPKYIPTGGFEIPAFLLNIFQMFKIPYSNHCEGHQRECQIRLFSIHSIRNMLNLLYQVLKLVDFLISCKFFGENEWRLIGEFSFYQLSCIFLNPIPLNIFWGHFGECLLGKIFLILDDWRYMQIKWK